MAVHSPKDMVEARRQRAAANVAVPPSATSLDTIPTQQDFDLAQAEHAKEERALLECQAKLAVGTRELRETNALLAELQARSAILEQENAQHTARVQVAKTSMVKHKKVMDSVNAIRARVGFLGVAPSSNEANLCGICLDRKKNRVFYKCGHQFCNVCADAIMRTKKQCSYCQGEILDVIALFD